MKRILTLLLLLPFVVSAQLKVSELTPTTTGVDGDILIKNDSAGGSGSTKTITIRALKSNYNIAADSLGLDQFAATTSAEFAGVISDESGTGTVVLSTSPTLVTPALGTPSAIVLTNATGTAASLSIGGNAATVTTNANLTGGVTSVGNAATVVTNANLTGDVTSVGNATTVITNANLTGEVTSVGNAATLGSFTSSSLSTALSDETGTGTSVFSVSPALTGTPTAPTASLATNTTQIATTAFVLANSSGDGDGIYDGSGTLPTTTVSTLTDTWSVTGGEVTFTGGGSTVASNTIVFRNSSLENSLVIGDDTQLYLFGSTDHSAKINIKHDASGFATAWYNTTNIAGSLGASGDEGILKLYKSGSEEVVFDMRGAVNNYNKLTGSTKVMLFGTNSVSGLEGKVTIKYDNSSLYGLRVDDGTGEVFRVASNVSGKGYLSLFNGATEAIKIQASTATGPTFFNAGNVSIGTTSDLGAKFGVVGLAEYADNAAAIVGGLSVGAFYRTGDLLKVVH